MLFDLLNRCELTLPYMVHVYLEANTLHVGQQLAEGPPVFHVKSQVVTHLLFISL